MALLDIPEHKEVCRAGMQKKGLLLFDYACHSCSETMLIFSVYLSVCLKSSTSAGLSRVCFQNIYSIHLF